MINVEQDPAIGAQVKHMIHGYVGTVIGVCYKIDKEPLVLVKLIPPSDAVAERRDMWVNASRLEVYL